ncbi:MAG: amidohydrolase family protein [Blastocatellia bacterium]|nr:amidohydrolase family protein [Blastocatellia bacterium]
MTVTAAIAGSGQCLAQDLAVRGETVYTMAGEPIRNGVVLIRGGKIEQVGPEKQVKIPAGYKTLTARVVTPGLIDAHTTTGLSGYLNQPGEQEQVEKSAPIQPELRALDAYNARERLVDWVRGYGVTTMNTGHGPGTLVSGQTMLVKTKGATVESAVLVPSAMVAVTLGGAGFADAGKAPGTRAKQIAMLRAEFIKAQETLRKQETATTEDKKPTRDLRVEMFVRLLKRELPLLVTAHRSYDILSALRLAKEFNLRLILDGAAESYLVMDEIKAAGVPVILHPTMYRSTGEAENLSMETAAKLIHAGIPVALQSGYEAYVPKTRMVLFEAGAAAANGLTLAEALGTITMQAAKILGISDRVGSLEIGKDGDVVLFDGDPFEYTSHVKGVVIEGVLVSEETH